MAKERIDKIIASTGKYSRKDVKQLIREGKVTADGQTVLRPEEKYDPGQAVIQIDRQPLHYQEYTYVMLFKPDGVITATEDAKQKTVMDLLPSEYSRKDMFPVGRLDKDTEGLLLITNDGALAHALLAPGKHVDKVYLVQVNGHLTEEDVKVFREGVILSDGYHCKPAALSITATDSENHISEALVTIQEGKYHQVKRMFAAIGKPLFMLKRLQMGPVKLDPSLAPGQFRELTAEEIHALKNPFPPDRNNN